MVDIADRQEKAAGKEEPAERKPLPRWMITVASVTILLIVWEIFGRRINPVFGSYPSAIAEAFWELVVTGQLWSALYDSLRPFVIGYALAILIGVPLGLFIGGFRAAESALDAARRCHRRARLERSARHGPIVAAGRPISDSNSSVEWLADWKSAPREIPLPWRGQISQNPPD